jgi:hypothetical protein
MQVYGWSKPFKEGRTEFENMPHVTWLRTSMKQANAEQIDGLIWDNLCIMASELAKTAGKCDSIVKMIIYDELNFNKLSAQWVPKLLSDERQGHISTQVLDSFEMEGDPFLHSAVTYDETWVH